GLGVVVRAPHQAGEVEAQRRGEGCSEFPHVAGFVEESVGRVCAVALDRLADVPAHQVERGARPDHRAQLEPAGAVQVRRTAEDVARVAPDLAPFEGRVWTRLPFTGP